MLLYTLIWIVVSSPSNTSIYLSYLFSLNYWSSNILFLFCFFNILTRVRSKLIGWVVTFNIYTSWHFGHILLKKKLVTTLYIGTLTIHPILFYFSLVILILKFVYYKTFSNHLILNLSRNALLYIQVVTLLLGGFWGFQSVIWGYFWVNDTVEWLLLLTIIYLGTYIHKLSSNQTSINKLLYLLLLINIIMLVRLNIFPTRHSFIQSVSTSYILTILYSLFILSFWNVTLYNAGVISMPIVYSFVPFIQTSPFFLKFSLVTLVTFLFNYITPKFFKKKF